MLCLSRNKGEHLVIADNIIVKVLEVRGNLVRIGVSAPKEMVIRRGERRPETEREKLIRQGALRPKERKP